MIRDKILLCGLVLLSSHLFSQKTFTYNGNTINLDDIPLGRSLDKSIDGSKKIVAGKSLSNQKFFASDNKKFVVVTELYDNVSAKSNASTEGTIKLYSSDGKLLWEKKKDNYAISECKIDPVGTFIHANWSFQGEDANTKLVSYDKNGNEVNTVEEVQYFYSGENKDKLYYIKRYSTNNPDDQFKLYFKDLSTGKKWEKLFPSTRPLVVLNISKDNKTLAVASDNLYYMNNAGEIIWKQKCNESPGNISISSKGENILWNPQHGVAHLIDKYGKSLWTKEETLIDGLKFKVYRASFVDNSENLIAFVDIISPETSMIILYNLQGALVEKHVFKKVFHGNMTVLRIDNILLIFSNGYKIYEYQTNIKNV